MGKEILNLLNSVDEVMYYPILIIVMSIAGVYFTVLTRGVQIRMFLESCRLIMEPSGDGKVSSFQALMVSTASRVGTGNIIGVSTAICLGGPGACFWMWVMCIIGASSAFIESTLAQIYKRKDANGECYGGPAYYIEKALHAPVLAAIFAVFLIVTYAGGFNPRRAFTDLDMLLYYLTMRDGVATMPKPGEKPPVSAGTREAPERPDAGVKPSDATLEAMEKVAAEHMQRGTTVSMSTGKDKGKGGRKGK